MPRLVIWAVGRSPCLPESTDGLVPPRQAAWGGREHRLSSPWVSHQPLLQHGADLELLLHSTPLVHLLESVSAEGRRHGPLPLLRSTRALALALTPLLPLLALALMLPGPELLLIALPLLVYRMLEVVELLELIELSCRRISKCLELLRPLLRLLLLSLTSPLPKALLDQQPVLHLDRLRLP